MSRLFALHGREARLTYWRLNLLVSVLNTVVWCAGLAALMAFGRWGALIFVGFLPVLAMSIALGVRRMHDRGRSGAWFGVFTLGPFGSETAAYHIGVAGMEWLATAFVALGVIIYIWGFVELGVLGAARGHNRYGPSDPRPATVEPGDALPRRRRALPFHRRLGRSLEPAGGSTWVR